MIGYLDSFQQDRQRHQERERCRKTKNKASLWTVFYISLFDALFYSRNFISSFLLRGWKSEWWSLGEHLINKTYLGKKMPCVDWSSQISYFFYTIDWLYLHSCASEQTWARKRMNSGWIQLIASLAAVSDFNHTCILTEHTQPSRVSETAFCSRSNLQVQDFGEFFNLVVTRHCKSLKSFICGITVSRRSTILQRACEVYVCKLEFGRKRKKRLKLLTF